VWNFPKNFQPNISKGWKRFWNLKAIFPKRYFKKFFRNIFQIKLLFWLIKIVQNISQNLRLYSPKYFGKFRVAWSCRVLCQEHIWTLFSACFWDSVQSFSTRKPFLGECTIKPFFIDILTGIYEKIKSIQDWDSC